MGTPKQRHTKSRRNKRRSHHALKRANFLKCPKCDKPVLAHRICPHCGTYNGREVIDVLAKLTKRERKKRIKEEAKEEKKKEKEDKKTEPLSPEELSKG